MSARAGLMTYPFRLQRPTTGPVAYVNSGLWWAGLETQDSPAGDGAVQSEAVHELEGYWRRDITNRWRATYDGRWFRFQSIRRIGAERMIVVATETVGAAIITFTDTTQTRDPVTGHVSPTTVAITGLAVQEPGDPERYKQLQMSVSESPTLRFTPDIYGTIPAPGNRCTWGGKAYTVRDVEPQAPTGYAITARVIIAA